MGGTLSKEVKFAKDLKKSCDQKGKEKNPKKSAIIFHDWGMLYKEKNPDKLNLIQSAALLNAAIARQPFNEGLKKDLRVFCSYILELACAKNQQSDLVELSHKVEVKIKAMRDEVAHSLKKINKIPFDVSKAELKKLEEKKIEDMKQLQDEVALKYSDIMDYVSNECIEIMGDPPCRYAVTGMGSLARREITPYSDFEHVIVLEEGVQNNNDYEKILEYFRWFSVMFQITLINLKETILRWFAIPLLNDFTLPRGDWFFDAHTSCGISFDGMNPHACKFPLGRMQKTVDKPFTIELIKPVSGMVNYLTIEEDMKNGYHLSDILTKTCFVSGDRDVYKEFASQAKNILKENHTFNISSLSKQLDEDMVNFNVINFLTVTLYTNNFDVKRVIYRTVTLFISALGRLHSIDECSCFGIIAKLQEQQLMDDETAHLLSYAVAIACETRLRVYMDRGGQDDYLVQEEFYVWKDLSITPQLIEFVGERSLVNYFEVALALGTLIKINFGDYISFKLPQLGRFFVLFLLKLYDHLHDDWNCYLQNKTTRMPSEEELLVQGYRAFSYFKTGQFDKSLALYEMFSQHFSTDTDALLRIGICLYRLKRYEDAIEKLELLEKQLHKESISGYDEFVLCVVITYHGNCEMKLGHFSKGITLLNKAMSYTNHDDAKFKISKADCLLNIGKCLMNLLKLDEAIVKLNEALGIFNTSLSSIYSTCDVFNNLGVCYLNKRDYDRALAYFHESLQLLLKHVPCDRHETDDEIRITRLNIQLTLQQISSKKG